MRIIVYPHSMEIGGSQLNAIEIAAAVQRQGHEVLLVAEDGPLAAKAASLGLERFRIHRHRRRPSVSVMRKLLNLVRHRRVEVVHGYEWPPAVEAWLGPGLLTKAVPFATIMSGEVAPFLPHSLSVAVGTHALRLRCLEKGFSDVTLLEPPVDVHENSPDVDSRSFRADLGISSSVVLIVVVCRLAYELKLEGLLSACRAVGHMVGQGASVRLAIIGDGPARDEVQTTAQEANAVAGCAAVLLCGESLDPRQAYASADVVIGMGGSALRGMAFGKPLIVQGERGFWQLCDQNSARLFLENGWYGVGDGSDGAVQFSRQLQPLLDQPHLLRRLGQFSRELVVNRFGLENAARVQVCCYERVIEKGCSPSPGEVLSTCGALTAYKVKRRWARMRGTAAGDDFNALNHMLGTCGPPPRREQSR